MASRFDPNIPATADPTDPCIEGEVSVVAVTEHPTLGKGNLVVNPDQHFHLRVDWRVFGNLTPLWLQALSGTDWEITAYAESVGPGDEKVIARRKVAVGTSFTQNQKYSTELIVPADALPEENPGDPSQSGVYKLAVTVFLNSALGAPGYDMMGYAEGPIIKVEDPN